MSEFKYRIKTITIEGFRGFTKPQRVDLEGKNAFVFGPNGHGKSSIIEAIRWCLFGSPSGKDIEVRNTFYMPGVCKVSLTLARIGSEIHLRRELRPGATRSRRTITDEDGNTLLEQNALPQLARIGHQQGTQVIFSAQQAVGRQAQVDISNFTHVLCFYLNLERVPDLIEIFNDRVEEYTVQVNEMGFNLEKVEAGFREKLRDIEARLSELIDNAPWDDTSPPTSDETSNAVLKFINEQARFYGQQQTDSNDAHALNIVKQWIDEAGRITRDDLKTRVDTIRQTANKGKVLYALLQSNNDKIESLRDVMVSNKKRLGELLVGKSLQSISRDLEQKESTIKDVMERLDVLNAAALVCRDFDENECPVCGADQTSRNLIDRIVTQQSALNERCPDASEVEQLRDLVSVTQEIDITIEEVNNEIEAGLEEASNIEAELRRVFEIDDNVISDFNQLVSNAEIDLQNLENELSNAEIEITKRHDKIHKLERELRFHDYRDQVGRLQWQLSNGLEDVRERHRDYQDLLSSMEKLAKVVEESFNDVLDRAIPPLNIMMTEVYARLTGQVSYDQVRVVANSENRTRRELRVATSRISDQTFPTNVLNGQAAKAIQLVPYFVFSRFHPDIMELDLLLIDDPSESFDTSHVGRLVGELAEASGHAQLVVATHEKEKFEPHLAEYFNDNLYLKLTVKGFDPIDGPQLENY